MKYFIVTAIVALAGALYYFAGAPGNSPEDAAHAQWKQNAVENETAVRPEGMADSKWTPDHRVPASDKTK